MRFLSTLICIIVLAAISTWFFPWWSIAVICAFAGFLGRLRPASAFLCGFLGIALMWVIAGLWRSAVNDYLLLGRMAGLFRLPAPWMYIAISILPGGLVGGLAALSGVLLRNRRVTG